MKSIRDEYLGLGTTTNRYVRNHQIPIGTRQPYETYQNGDVPDSDVVRLDVSPKHQFSFFLTSVQGTNKTVLQKRIATYLHKMNFNQLYFDHKAEMMDAHHYGCGMKLLPEEKTEPLPVQMFLPSFNALRMPETLNALSDRFKIFSMKLNQIKMNQDLRTLKFTPAAAYWVLNKLQDLGKDASVEDLEKAVWGIDNFAMRDGIIRLLDNFKQYKFFDNQFDSLDLTEVWKKNKIACVCPMVIDNEANSFIAGMSMLDEYYKRKKGKKFVFLDDGQVIVSALMNAQDYKSIDAFNNHLLALGRKAGWGGGVATQTPKLVHPTTIDLLCGGYRIIGRVLTDATESFVPYKMKEVIEKLDFQPKKFRFQYCLIHPNNEHDLFYPLGPIAGHESWEVPAWFRKEMSMT